jgi:hypothetical protein
MGVGFGLRSRSMCVDSFEGTLGNSLDYGVSYRIRAATLAALIDMRSNDNVY